MEHQGKQPVAWAKHTITVTVIGMLFFGIGKSRGSAGYKLGYFRDI